MREGILFGKLVPFLKRRIFFERILEREIEHWYSQKNILRNDIFCRTRAAAARVQGTKKNGNFMCRKEFL